MTETCLTSTDSAVADHLYFAAKEIQYSCFPFDNSPPLAFSAVGLVIDLGVLLLLVTGLWMTLREVPLPRMQFSVRSLMITTAVLSLLLGTNLLFSRHMHMLLSFTVMLATMLFCLWRAARRWTGPPRIAREQDDADPDHPSHFGRAAGR